MLKVEDEKLNETLEESHGGLYRMKLHIEKRLTFMTNLSKRTTS